MEKNAPLKPEEEAAKPKTEPGEISRSCFLLIISENLFICTGYFWSYL